MTLAISVRWPSDHLEESNLNVFSHSIGCAFETFGTGRKYHPPHVLPGLVEDDVHAWQEAAAATAAAPERAARPDLSDVDAQQRAVEARGERMDLLAILAGHAELERAVRHHRRRRMDTGELVHRPQRDARRGR